MKRLSNKVAIVTGGAQGIGGATARRLAEEGAKVLIADIDTKTAQQNVQTIKSFGGIADKISVDIMNPEDIEAMIKKAVDQWGQLDILVNNAFSRGTTGSAGGALEVTDEGWDMGMKAVIKHVFLATKYAVPEMKKVQCGSIVNISSVHGLLMSAQSIVYETWKTAMLGATRQMAVDFGPWNIRVNAICPGHIVNETQAQVWELNPTRFRFFKEQYPLRRTGQTVDIANAVVFLCSEEASFITGLAMVVDGGLSIQLQDDFAKRMALYIDQHPQEEGSK